MFVDIQDDGSVSWPTGVRVHFGDHGKQCTWALWVQVNGLQTGPAGLAFGFILDVSDDYIVMETREVPVCLTTQAGFP